MSSCFTQTNKSSFSKFASQTPPTHVPLADSEKAYWHTVSVFTVQYLLFPSCISLCSMWQLLSGILFMWVPVSHLEAIPSLLLHLVSFLCREFSKNCIGCSYNWCSKAKENSLKAIISLNLGIGVQCKWHN